jgi:tetratricopeptide (TPR) repeat protein
MVIGIVTPFVMKYILFFFLFLAIPFISLAQTSAQNTQHARELMDKGKYKAASKFLTGCIKKEVNNAEYFYLRSVCFMQMDRRQDAIGDATWAIKLAPDSVNYRIERASDYYLTAQFEKAASDYKRGLQIAKTAKDTTEIYGRLGQVMVVLGDTAGGIAMLETCLKRDSMCYAGLVNFAMVLNDCNRSAEGVVFLERALTLDSNDVKVLSNLGFCYSTMGEYAKAIPYFDRCIRLVPGDAIPYNNRGYCKLKLGDLNGAMADVNISIKLFPENSYAYRNLGLIYKAKGDNAAACEAWNKALYYGFTMVYGNEVDQLLKAHCR